MHELSVTQGILKICLEECKKHNIKKIKEINEYIKKNEIELITAKDIEIDVKVDESGKNCIENGWFPD